VFVPTLDECVETLARRRMNKTLQSLMETALADREAEEEFALLKRFIESADFRRLRAESEPELLQGHRVAFNVGMDSGTVTCRMQVEP